MKKNIVVKKSTTLINSYWNLSLVEHRILNFIIGQKHYKTAVKHGEKLKISSKDFAEQFRITTKEASFQLKKIYDSNFSAGVRLSNDEANTISWTKEVIRVDNESYEVIFSDELIQYLFNLKGGFVKYNIECIVQMKKSHSIRLYELCKTVAYDGAGWRVEISLEIIKQKFLLGNNYHQYGSFKRLINECIIEINELTDINVFFNEKRRGKMVVALEFIVKDSEKKHKA